jgi:hypothetical protein
MVPHGTSSVVKMKGGGDNINCFDIDEEDGLVIKLQ